MTAEGQGLLVAKQQWQNLIVDIEVLVSIGPLELLGWALAASIVTVLDAATLFCPLTWPLPSSAACMSQLFSCVGALGTVSKHGGGAGPCCAACNHIQSRSDQIG